MKTIHWLALLLVAGSLTLPPALDACPLCKEAIPASGGEDEEINNLPAAYNNSIYLMAGVPYLALGAIGFVIYRGYRG